jgi:hypothetical protein
MHHSFHSLVGKQIQDPGLSQMKTINALTCSSCSRALNVNKPAWIFSRLSLEGTVEHNQFT